MSRLDQHIDAVRTRFLLQRMINYLAWTVLCAAAAIVLLTLVVRIFNIALPPQVLLLGGAAVLAIFIALVLAVAFSPSREATAVQIDKVLGLKERYSTALAARGSSDVFAQAAVSDAEKTSDSVSIRKRFPLTFPRHGYYAMSVILALAITDRFMPQLDVFGREEQKRQAAIFQKKQFAAEKALRDALYEVQTIPKIGAHEKGLQAARNQIEALLNSEIKDPEAATRTARNALQEAESARQKIQDSKRYADGKTQKEAFKPLTSQNSSGMLDDAKQAMADGKFDQAAAKLKEAVTKFNAADAAGQQKAAEEMKSLAEQLNQIAADPNIQQRIRKELEKQGASPEQARALSDEMSKAAAGDKDAQRRAREMSENLARRANGGLLPAPEQLAPLMQKIDQMQGQMSAQQQASELAQAANQLASAMQKQAQANQQKQPGSQGQKNQQQANQQSGESQQNAQNSQQSGQQSGSESADTQAAMEAAMAQLEAMQQANEAAQANSGAGQGQGEGDDGQGWGDGGAQGQGGDENRGFGQGPSGPNMGGIGAGERPKGSPAPYTVKKEMSAGEADQRGKLIASWLVKADSVKGESKEQFKEIVMSKQRDQAEDVDQERVPMRAQKAVRDYFNSLQEEAQ